MSTKELRQYTQVAAPFLNFRTTVGPPPNELTTDH